MTETIWKYQLDIDDTQEIEMPDGAKILCMQEQNGIPCIWARVNPDADKKPVRIHMYETGHRHTSLQGRYIGTVQIEHVPVVFHIYAEDICREWNL